MGTGGACSLFHIPISIQIHHTAYRHPSVPRKTRLKEEGGASARSDGTETESIFICPCLLIVSSYCQNYKSYIGSPNLYPE